MSNYIIDPTEKYIENYNNSIAEPEKFWSDLAKNNFSWYEPWSKVLEWDFKKAKIEWFKHAKLNITVNCIDRHAKSNPEKTAIIFEPNNPNEKQKSLTYLELLKDLKGCLEHYLCLF